MILNCKDTRLIEVKKKIIQTVYYIRIQKIVSEIKSLLIQYSPTYKVTQNHINNKLKQKRST